MRGSPGDFQVTVEGEGRRMRPQTARRWSFLVTYCGIWGSVFRAISGPGSVCSCPDLACVFLLLLDTVLVLTVQTAR